VVLLKEHNQLNITVETVGRLGTTQERARETQLSLLHQGLACSIYFQVVLVVIMMILHDELPVCHGTNPDLIHPFTTWHTRPLLPAAAYTSVTWHSAALYITCPSLLYS
jgi:hypothetical protein